MQATSLPDLGFIAYRDYAGRFESKRHLAY